MDTPTVAQCPGMFAASTASQGGDEGDLFSTLEGVGGGHIGSRHGVEDGHSSERRGGEEAGIQRPHRLARRDCDRLFFAAPLFAEDREVPHHNGWLLCHALPCNLPSAGGEGCYGGAMRSPLLALLLLACERQEPVLTGIPAVPLLSDLPSAEDNRFAQANPAPPAAPAAYVSAPGVYVDVLHLGGKTFTTERDIVLQVMGELLESRDLPPGKGQEWVFVRGSLCTLDDRIYRITVPLPAPMRRDQALSSLGFPAIVSEYITFSGEFRLNHEWGFRRIRMKRAAPDSEEVIEVDAWRWVPGEYNLRLQ